MRRDGLAWESGMGGWIVGGLAVLIWAVGYVSDLPVRFDLGVFV